MGGLLGESGGGYTGRPERGADDVVLEDGDGRVRVPFAEVRAEVPGNAEQTGDVEDPRFVDIRCGRDRLPIEEDPRARLEFEVPIEPVRALDVPAIEQRVVEAEVPVVEGDEVGGETRRFPEALRPVVRLVDDLDPL